MSETGQAIHAAITKAMRDIAAIGIAKDHQASLGGAQVNYRGIEAAMNQMSGVLIRCKITVTPRYSDLTVTERAKGDPKDGKATRFVTLRGDFTFTSAEDGSSVTCSHYGEAMDSGDKAVTKAQSVAFRTALFQQFVVPTMAIDPEAGGDDDGAQAMTEEAVQRHLEAIRTATSNEALRDIYNAASQAAQAADDAEALKEFETATRQRKAEIKAQAAKVAA